MVRKRNRPPSGRVHLTPSGICSSSRPRSRSRFPLYSSIDLTRFSSSLPLFRNSAATYWSNIGGHRSRDCLHTYILSRISGLAMAHPRRNPGANIFENDPRWITRSGESEYIVGTGSPSYRSSLYGLSSTMRKSYSEARSTSICLSSKVSDSPDGFWKSGIIYRNFTCLPSALTCSSTVSYA